MRSLGAAFRLMRIAFFGLPLAALLLLRDGCSIGLAVLSPVDAPGRRRLGRALGAAVLDARELDDDVLEKAMEARVAEWRPELIVSWYWTRRLPRSLIESAPLGGIGVHPSLLPRHRGPNPFFWAIDSGDSLTGVTVHRLVDRYDEGDVLLREEVAVADRTAWELARALDRPSLRLLRRAVREIGQGTLFQGTPQDDEEATWAREPADDELRVDWRWPTERALRRVRALSPVPGLALQIRGVDLFVTEAKRARECPLSLEPGEAAATSEGVIVRTGDGAILLTHAVIAGEPDDEPLELGAMALKDRLGLGVASTRTV